MLVLNGRTSAVQTSFCWLSPASIGLASALRQEIQRSTNVSRAAVVDIYCQKKDPMAGSVKQQSVLVCLLLQLLEADSAVLRDADEFERLRSRIHESLSDIDRMLNLLLDIIANFDTVYLRHRQG